MPNLFHIQSLDILSLPHSSTSNKSTALQRSLLCFDMQHCRISLPLYRNNTLTAISGFCCSNLDISCNVAGNFIQLYLDTNGYNLLIH